MTDPVGPDDAWLNDDSDFQLNFVHGLRNPAGLRLRYALEGDHVVTTWTPGENHLGFPGLAHGGVAAAILDDIMGRCSVLQRRWVVTGRIEVRYRQGAPVGEPLRVEGWVTRLTRRLMQTESRMTLADGSVVAEASGTYLPVPPILLARMVEAWPGFREFIIDAP